MPLADWILMFAVTALVAAVLAANAISSRRRSAGQTANPAAASGQPMLAGALSLVIPGAGHALIGAWGRGAVWFVGFLVAAVASQAMHGPLVVVVMILAGFDAYWVARAPGDRSGVSLSPAAAGVSLSPAAGRAHRDGPTKVAKSPQASKKSPNIEGERS